MPGDYAALEASRLARGQRDTTAPVADDSKPYGGRVRETTADGLRFKFKFPTRGSTGRTTGWEASADKSSAGPHVLSSKHGGGFGHMTPERRREISRKANAARWGK